MKPLAIDLYCGLGGWTEGLLAEGYDVIGFDIERHVYGEHCYPAQLVIQDVLTLHGSQFRNADLIVASPPCQAYSWRSLPFAAGRNAPPPDNALFDVCFRLQREASEAAQRHVPLVVENVRGAQKWVGRARWNWGSFYLWGDIPALMPVANRDGIKNGGDWFGSGNDCSLQRRFSGSTKGRKNPGINLSEVGFNVASAHRFGHLVEGVKITRSDEDKRQHIGTKRKFASAMIAKIPLPLSRHIAATFKPVSVAA